MNLQTIPLNRLIPCPANVRKTGTSIGIEELAASIKAHGLLQNLQVRPGKGGKFEVAAGGRRLAALKLLAKQKALSKLAEIECNVLDDDEDPVEISLAENSNREPMHPADQFDAFKALADSGKGDEEIAGRFGCTAAVVRQRLKLASVSPRLMEVYREGEMNLDQLMAFCVSDDHEAQETVWFDQSQHHSPSSIRRVLTATQMEADDSVALFVTVDAYLAAGGHLNRDLFQTDHEGYLTDPALLNRLATAKLEAAADTIRAEGWAWVEVKPELAWDALRRYGRATPDSLPITEAEAEELDRLSGEYNALHEEHGDDPEAEVWQQMEEMSERIDELSEGHKHWTPEIMATSGVIVSIDRDGTLAVTRGLIRREDRQDAQQAAQAEDAPAFSQNKGGLSDRLIEDLTAQRTAALRVLLADNHAVALASVVHALALPHFYSDTASCLELRRTSPDLRDIKESRAAQIWAEREASWIGRLPSEAEGLWEWLLVQPMETLTALLAHCAASSVNAIRKAQDKAGAPRLTHADRLAATLGLDMAQWWQPTASGFFGRVPKQRIIEAVAEGCSPQTAENLVKLKKGDLAVRAEQKLTGTGWLPALLRPPMMEAAQPKTTEAA